MISSAPWAQPLRGAQQLFHARTDGADQKFRFEPRVLLARNVAAARIKLFTAVDLRQVFREKSILSETFGGFDPRHSELRTPELDGS